MTENNTNSQEAKLKALIPKYKEECANFLQKLIQTPSVNGEQNESDLAKVIQRQTEELGLSSQLYKIESNRPNVYVGDPQQFNNSDDVLFVAHSDTVPVGDKSKWSYPPFGAEVVNGNMYGRGALDCKGGIALSIYALKILQELGASNKAKLLVGVDEESGADSKIGIRHVLQQGLRARGAVYTYGGRATNALTIGHRGVLRVWVTCHGEAAHSGSRKWQDGIKGASAIKGIMDFLEGVEYQQSIATKYNEYFPGYQCVITPTLVSGGSSESRVPDKAQVLLDIRTLPEQDNQKIVDELKKITKKFTTSKIQFEFTIKNNVPAALSDPNDVFVQLAASVMKKIYGYEQISFKGSGPANEAHMLIKQGIPTVVGFGPTGEGFHANDEYAEVESIALSLEALASIALRR